MADALDFLGDWDGEKVDILAVPPPHMEYLAGNPELLERVSKRAKTAMSAGGDLLVTAGNTIAAKMQLINDLGSTELGLWPSLARSKESVWNGERVDEYWHYLPLRPALNIRLHPVSSSAEGEICEAVIVHNEEGGWVQPIFKFYPEGKERSLAHLFIQHPQHPALWKHHGRVDDLLNFITSEKFHPCAAERSISAHHDVEEVMMVGTRRAKSALIVRLKEGGKVEHLWSLVQEVNKDMPVYARMDSKDMIIVVDEPFPKTAKGSIQKNAVLDLYVKELDELYDKAVSTP